MWVRQTDDTWVHTSLECTRVHSGIPDHHWWTSSQSCRSLSSTWLSLCSCSYRSTRLEPAKHCGSVSYKKLKRRESDHPGIVHLENIKLDCPFGPGWHNWLDSSACEEVRHAWSPNPLNPMFTWTAISRQKCEATNAHKSFALIFPKRTVGITAATADQCKALMEGFSALCFWLQVANLAEQGTKKEIQSPDKFKTETTRSVVKNNSTMQHGQSTFLRFKRIHSQINSSALHIGCLMKSISHVFPIAFCAPTMATANHRCHHHPDSIGCFHHHPCCHCLFWLSLQINLRCCWLIQSKKTSTFSCVVQQK